MNNLINNLLCPIEEVQRIISAVAVGDLSQSILIEGPLLTPVRGEHLHVANCVNQMMSTLNSFSAELTEHIHNVGIEGKLGGKAQVNGVTGTWKALMENVNTMSANLTGQVRAIAQVTTAGMN